MAWTKYSQFHKPTNTVRRIALNSSTSSGATGGINGYTENSLHKKLKGKFDRIERYRTFDWMDSDSDISRALDLIAEHCTTSDKDGNFFYFFWRGDDPTPEISLLLQNQLMTWTRRNEWKKRILRVIRNTVKYGDWFLLRNPNTFELYDLHPRFVTDAVVDMETNEIVAWVVKDFTFSIPTMEINVNAPAASFYSTTQMTNTGSVAYIPAEHVLHLSMSEGRFAGTAADDGPGDRHTNRWPFGESWLDQIYKTFTQRELLEDSMIIHRTQRAPHRLLWKVDVGQTMRADQRTRFVNHFKNELNQARNPRFSGRNNRDRLLDSNYETVSPITDYYVPVDSTGRGTSVEMLEGKPWDTIPELEYFKKKMLSALRVPYAWMQPANEGGALTKDGKSGVAYHEEIEFSRFCVRIQNLVIDSFDHEFKLYCEFRDIAVNVADFELQFHSPDSYELSRRLAVWEIAMPVYERLRGDGKNFSIRWLHQNVLGLTESQINENEQMRLEEMMGEEAPQDGGGSGFGGGIGGDLGGGSEVPGDFGPGPEGGLDLEGGGEDDIGGDLELGGEPGGEGPFGESVMRKQQVLNEVELDDINPVPTKASSDSLGSPTRTPRDNLFMAKDVLKPTPLATLKVIQRLRLAKLAKDIGELKRLRQIHKIYGNQEESGL